jgi:hypothetical protein
MIISNTRIRQYQALFPSQALLAALGFTPIGGLCLALFGILPLWFSTIFVVLPAGVLAITLGVRHPQLGKLAASGLVAGIIATAVYDAFRLSFVIIGIWSDFIPVIGQMILSDASAAPFWGYLWRYVGNGGAMGLTFALLPWRGLRAGMVYGTAICCCLLGTLILAPSAQTVLFYLTPVTATTALIGHLLYGATLGWLLQAAPDYTGLS